MTDIFRIFRLLLLIVINYLLFSLNFWKWTPDIFLIQSLFAIVILTSTPGYIPLDKNLIRILDSKSTWILSKIDSNKTKVTLQSYAEIDKIPSFVVDMFILDGPLHSMKNLRKNF